MPRSAWIFPLLAVLLFAGATGLGIAFTPTAAGIVFALVLLVILFGTVFAAVHHAEVIAQQIGEPFGTLLLTLAVTVIEVALITTIMLGDKSSPALARDTVFAVVMIVCNGLVGVCILVGAFHFREQEIQTSGSALYLSVLVVLATITLILPNYTLATPGPVYSLPQLVFVSIVTIVLYGAFLYIQTVRHRDYFIRDVGAEADGHEPGGTLAFSVLLLLVALVAVVLLAKKFAVVVDAGIEAVGAPPALAAIVVALLVLLPESVAAVEAARKDNLQKSLNLALGSSLATIGLTVPAVAVVTIALHKPMVLGLSARDSVLLLLTVILSTLTFGTGRTNILFGFVHALVFAVFVFMVFAP